MRFDGGAVLCLLPARQDWRHGGRCHRPPGAALNKAVSQFVHVVNTAANSGWVVEENSLDQYDAV